jgi:bacillolysin
VFVAVPRAQQPAQPFSRSIAASGDTLAGGEAEVLSMLRLGQLDIARVQEDTMMPGRSHERLEQRHEGLPVFGGQLVRQMDQGRMVSVFGQLYENVSLPTLEPLVRPQAAQGIAEADLGDGAIAGPPDLGILPRDGQSLLVYRMKVRSGWDICHYFVNARTGGIEQRDSLVRFQEAPALGSGTGVLSDPKKVSATRVTGGYQAIDSLRPAAAFTLNFRGSVSRFNAFLQNGTVFFSDVATSSNNTWTDGAIVDAHVYEGWVYDYFFKRFARRGIDDRNIELISIVHPLARTDAASFPPNIVGTWINNAAYLGDGFLLFGDGDGRLFDYLAGGFDVVAHEIAHGVTEYSSGLIYQDEPGALNEAFSDIMAIGAEYFLFRPGQGPQRGPNFLVGEDVTRVPPGYIRSAQSPADAGYPDHYSLRQYIGTPTDNGGVHVNATIVTHAFYLATVGGRNRVSGITVQGVGLTNIERMERIFYRAFVFLTGSRAQFSDARAATLQAATDLFGSGSNERAQLLQAWSAVGVP